MSRFFSKIFLFSIIPFLSFFGVFLAEKGDSDFYYTKLTGKRKGSFIIGNSKASQGIIPEILNSNIRSINEVQFFNYAFTSNISPYGESYLTSIKAKIDKSKKNNYIVCIDVWSLIENKDKSKKFIEKGGFIDEVKYVNMTPNFEYLLNFYEKQYFEIILRRFDPSFFKLHDSGWLELDLAIDSVSRKERLDERINIFKNQINNIQFSEERFRSLIEVINFLKVYGNVFLVKIPSKKEISYFENLIAPNLDERFKSLSQEISLPYLNLDSLSSNFIYTDGLHLYKESSKDFSLILSNWLDSKID